MAFFHETFGNVDIAPTHVIGNHEKACGSPARHWSSVLHIEDTINRRIRRGNDRYEAHARDVFLLKPKPQSEIETQEVPRVQPEPRTITR